MATPKEDECFWICFYNTRYSLNKDLNISGQSFKKGSSFIIPSIQPQFRLIRALFEKTLNFRDSIFYDITSWTLPLALGLPYAELNASQFQPGVQGELIMSTARIPGTVNGGKSSYGYIMSWKDLFAPAALYELQKNGVRPRVATVPFTMNMNGENRRYSEGTIWIPLSMQAKNENELYEIMKKLAEQRSLHIDAVKTGGVISGSDLGSSKFVPLEIPKVAMITGHGVNQLDAGEIWHLMDQRFDIPMTHLETMVFNRADLSRYNTLVMVSGEYQVLN